MYESVSIAPSAMSSFDAPPKDHLDPHLFDGVHMQPAIRQELLGTILQYLDVRYEGVHDWLRAWIAGSGASYRWGVGSPPYDLDVLLGVDWVSFRAQNPDYVRLSDQELASHINEGLRLELWPHTAHWHGSYEVTWYVNPHSQDIRTINPYAAYDLIEDAWTVVPSQETPVIDGEWHRRAAEYARKAEEAVARYSAALSGVNAATNPVHSANARAQFSLAVSQAVGLYDAVHQGRKAAFSPTGGGYGDFSNYLWQSGKRAGWVPALRSIKEFSDAAKTQSDAETYGVELPDHDTLVRRAALRYR